MADLTILRTEDIATCHALRRAVFIEEQNVPEADEMDGRDDEAMHLLAVQNGRPIGTARLFVQGDTGKIGRVCVLADGRGQGVGAALIREALAVLAAQPGVRQAKLGSQRHAIAFYERLGFGVVGPEYDDAGIPHQDMVREL